MHKKLSLTRNVRTLMLQKKLWSSLCILI